MSASQTQNNCEITGLNTKLWQCKLGFWQLGGFCKGCSFHGESLIPTELPCLVSCSPSEGNSLTWFFGLYFQQQQNRASLKVASIAPLVASPTSAKSALV